MAGQNIEHMAYAHQGMIPLHGIPVIGKTVFVLISMMFFNKDAAFDAPAEMGTQIATFMKVAPVQRFA